MLILHYDDTVLTLCYCSPVAHPNPGVTTHAHHSTPPDIQLVSKRIEHEYFCVS